LDYNSEHIEVLWIIAMSTLILVPMIQVLWSQQLILTQETGIIPKLGEAPTTVGSLKEFWDVLQKNEGKVVRICSSVSTLIEEVSHFDHCYHFWMFKSKCKFATGLF